MEGADQSNPCAICLAGMGAGGGQAIFTAECSHTFHFHCISESVAHGNLVCPLCNARWRELPSVVQPQPAPVPRTLPQPLPMHRVQPLPTRHVPLHGWQPQHQSDEPQVFDDDERVEPPSSGDGGGDQRQAAASSRSGGTLAVTTHTEYSAVARDSSRDNFAVLVHVKAPGMTTDGEAAAGDAPRAPLDLVTVLDVSGSMTGAKLALLKQAMGFVVDNLGPHDRLSVVSFSDGARRVTRLLLMSGDGKATAKNAVESLVARGGTNIAEGLRTAAKVLEERRHRNTVSSVILLSDGQDTYTAPRRSRAAGAAPNYEALVPPSFMATGTRDWSAPVHTFGFGNDHDAVAMHVITEATAGTFSYIENEAVIQDAFAQCIGGLLTVVVQEARVAIAAGHPGVRIGSIKSGRYESRVDEDGRSASVRVGELYADEERRFLLFLSFPAVEATDGETALIKVNCSYRDTAGGAHVDVTAEDTVVARPEQVVDAERSTEVERERVRVEAAEDIAAARAAAERGAHQEAVRILEIRQQAVAQSEAALGGDATIQSLGAELHEMRRLVSNGNSYARSGRAFMLAGMSMHAYQRASANMINMNGPMNMAAEAASFATPAMRAMLLRSRRAREESSVEQQPPSKAGKKQKALHYQNQK
ncbi:E3 ubiquitin-protein ligase WAV3-like [Miscanthus floridulus]|uniref:E3 ubiquitin-protein ligase WAV3-like n=1 Tax=Miscanthus floridulus TaxID=154761 RepID=UPI00345B4C24